MLTHLRANLWLLALTLLLCSVLYPLLLWVVGQTVFLHQAQGSLIDEQGKPFGSGGEAVGSRLIAQPFTGKQYFQPRPSAVDYNASASGASNFGSSNPLLRARVAQKLGPIVKYPKNEPALPQIKDQVKKEGPTPQEKIERWFQERVKDEDRHPAEDRFVARWATDHPAVAEQWIKDNAEAVAAWVSGTAESVKSQSGDLVKTFFKDYAGRHPGTWPGIDDVEVSKGKTAKRIKPVRDGEDVQSNLFDLWLQEHPDEVNRLARVPADLVMASGSGLDPHITLENALYQLDRVAQTWAETTKRDQTELRREIADLLRQQAEAPLGGLVGVELVNVLEVNLALRNRYGAPARANR
jgi:potassium-transporting ATPase KdpC subunit